MIRTVQFEGHSVEINTSAGWLFVYRNHFGRDILPDIMPAIETILQMAIDIIGQIDVDEVNANSLVRAIDEDVLEDAFAKMAGAELITAYQIFWAAAKNRNNGIPGPEAYFNQFESFPIDEIAPQLMSAILESSISSKNVKSLLKRLKKTTRSTSTESSSQESTEG